MREGRGASRRHDASRLLRFGFGLFLLLTIVAIAGNAAEFATGGIRTPGPRDVLPIESGLTVDAPSRPRSNERVEIPEPVVIALVVVCAVAVLYLLSKQKLTALSRRPSIRFRRTPQVDITTDSDDAEVIAEIARDLIDELNAGDNPRHAIQRAYAAVESGFGSDEFARRPAETPLRYLDRIFGRHQDIRGALAELTELFQRARFSADPVDETMRSEAVDALSEIREYYTTASWRRIATRRDARRRTSVST